MVQYQAMKHIKIWVSHNFGARLDDLKKEGYEFKTEWESTKNRYGENTTYKRYSLAEMVENNLNHIPILE